MDFDLISMKQRAKSLMSGTKPSPILAGVILGAIAFAYVVVFYVIMMVTDDDSAMWVLYLMIAELVYLNFRTSMHWYCLRVTREETTKISDAFLAFNLFYCRRLLFLCWMGITTLLVPVCYLRDL